MLIHYLFILGICVEAVTGAIAAGRKKMDFFGVILIACITALGGGTVRDTLLNTQPLTWVSHPEYLMYTTLCALLTIFVASYIHRILRLFLILDALGLATFVIIGAEKSLAHGLSPSIAVIGGMLTGISGGMLRDILCNDIPLVLRRELYATIALAGAFLYIGLDALHVNHHFNILFTLSCIFVIRLFAIFFHIEMPKFDYSESLRQKRQ